MGGIETRPFATLKEELAKAGAYVEDLTEHSEELTTARLIKELGETGSAAVLLSWYNFIDMVQFWPLRSDDGKK